MVPKLNIFLFYTSPHFKVSQKQKNKKQKNKASRTHTNSEFLPKRLFICLKHFTMNWHDWPLLPVINKVPVRSYLNQQTDNNGFYYDENWRVLPGMYSLTENNHSLVFQLKEMQNISVIDYLDIDYFGSVSNSKKQNDLCLCGWIRFVSMTVDAVY